MKVLVTGGRDYWGDVEVALGVIHERHGITMLIHGGARGADSKAGQWATANGVHVAVVPALWDHFGKAAGYKRNEAMLQLKPDYCIAFPGGNGTASMVSLCIKNNITVWKPYD